jgi:hypothetical protein
VQRLQSSHKKQKDNFVVPVVFHNLKNYDVHHIFRHFCKSIASKYDKKGKASYRSVKIIALNLERYISFEIEHLRFIDSYQFLNAKLKKLVNNLPRDSLRHTKRHMGDNELLFAKESSRTKGSIRLGNSIAPNCRPKTRSTAN